MMVVTVSMEKQTVKFDLAEPDDKIYAELSSRFTEYNSAHSTWHHQSYCIFQQVDDHIVAGGRGIINMGALEVRGLWVDENLRGGGIGIHLLTAIENEARNRGATKAMLYTFSWQAERFYERAGYSAFSRFDYPDGFQRIDLQKAL